MSGLCCASAVATLIIAAIYILGARRRVIDWVERFDEVEK